ncbi:SAF domain-containing protein [Actinomycetota bacterium]
MSNLPTPAAKRLRKPSWRDARLLSGLLLVLLSTAAGSWAIAHADDRVPMYAASGPLLPGQALSADRLTRVDVRLDEAVAGYLSAGTALPGDAVVLREVRPGELVPASALGTRDELDSQPLTLQADATSASTLKEGSVVDVYVNLPKSGAGAREFEGPQKAVESASVLRLGEDRGALGSTSATRPIVLMVPSSQVGDLIGAVDNGARVTLVAVPGAVTKGAS